MAQKRKLEKKIINGKKCERYEGDTLWVLCKEQS